MFYCYLAPKLKTFIQLQIPTLFDKDAQLLQAHLGCHLLGVLLVIAGYRWGVDNPV